MKQFSYKARDASGATSSGIVESLSDRSAAKVLQERGLLVVSIAEKRVWNWKNLSFGLLAPTVSEREVATFTGLLATMLSTGLPLTDALDNLTVQTQNNYFREILRSVVHDVQSGLALSEAMGRYPKVFNGLYVNMIKAGEASGKMDEIMGKLGETMETNLEFKSKISGALVYPAVVVLTMLVIGVFMLTTIIPKIAVVYKEFGSELPLPTRILIGASTMVSNYLLLVLAAVGLLVFGIRTLRKNPTSEYLLNNLYFRIPVLGQLSSEATVTVISRTLGMLLYSGVGILDSLQILTKVVENNYFRSGLSVASASVEKGLPLSLALRRDPHFPMIMSQLLAIGEETGTVDQSLLKMAKYYQEITERKTKTLATLLEPLLILLMGSAVGGLAIAVLLPMFNLVNVIK